MGFNDSGLGVYQLTFSKNDTAVINEWVFGSITWSDGAHNVRSPIALKPTIPPAINVAGTVSIDAASTSARITIPVDVNYNGRFYVKGVGLAQSDVVVDTVYQDPDQTFSFNEDGLGFYLVDVNEGTSIAKFGLYGADQASGVDLDLFVYICPTFATCRLLDQSAQNGSDESVVVVNPEPAILANGGTYLVFVHGWSLAGAESVDAPLNTWMVDGTGVAQQMTVRASSVARDGRTNLVYVSVSELESGKDYVGGIIYSDENGNENGMTVVEVNAQ